MPGLIEADVVGRLPRTAHDVGHRHAIGLYPVNSDLLLGPHVAAARDGNSVSDRKLIEALPGLSIRE
jgi:hypothetical protein